jgi:hypothetical protein
MVDCSDSNLWELIYKMVRKLEVPKKGGKGGKKDRSVNPDAAINIKCGVFS